MPRTPGSCNLHNRVKTARQRAWNAMRVLKEFTLLDLEMSAEIAPDNIRKYVNALHRAGYLRQRRPKQNGKDGGSVIWRLVNHTGPLAPILRSDGSGMYDPNRKTLVPYQDPPPAPREAVHERCRPCLPPSDPSLAPAPCPAEPIHERAPRKLA